MWRSWVGGPASGLAVFRIAVCVAWLLVLNPRLAEHYSSYPPELLFPPCAWRWIIDWFPIDGVLVRAAFKVGVLGVMLGALGVRAGLLLALLAGGYVATLPQLFGKINHYNHVLWFTLLLLASPSCDALTVSRRRPEAGVAYGVPLRIAAVLIGLCYFFPGVWKLAGSGVGWCSAGTLRAVLYEKWAELGGFEPCFPIDRYGALCAMLAAGTVAFELCVLPVMFMGERARRLMVAAGVCFHTGTLVFMRIDFTHLVVCYTALLAPWGDLRTRGRSAGPVIVGALLIAAQVREGVARGQNWPMGLYPTFEAAPHDNRDVVVIRVEWGDGQVRELTEVMLGSHSSPERARGQFASILNGDPAKRGQRLEAVWHVWKGLDPTLASARRAEFVLRTVPIAPGTSGIVRQEVLHVLPRV